MQRVLTAAIGGQFPSANANTWQDNTLGIAQLRGAMTGCPYIYSTSGTTIKIGAIAGLVTTGNPNHNLSTTAESTYTPTSPALANNTWYHLYCYHDGAGAIAFEHATEASAPPDASLTFKGPDVSVDTTRRYLGPFRTNGSAAIIPYHQAGRKVRYLVQTAGNTELKVLTDGDDTSYTVVECGTRVPYFSRMVDLHLAWSPQIAVSPSFNSVELRTEGVTTAGAELSFQEIGLYGTPTTTADDAFSYHFPFLLSGLQELEYKTSNTDCSVGLFVVGYDW